MEKPETERNWTYIGVDVTSRKMSVFLKDAADFIHSVSFNRNGMIRWEISSDRFPERISDRISCVTEIQWWLRRETILVSRQTFTATTEGFRDGLDCIQTTLKNDRVAALILEAVKKFLESV